MNIEKHTNQSDEITLKELILIVQKYFNEILKRWKLIALFCLITTSFFLYKHFTHIPTYKAELRFVVEGQGGVSGGLGGLLGSFGIKKGGGVNPYKILEITKSNKLSQRVLFSEFSSDSTIAAKLVREYKLIDKWSESNDSYVDFQFKNKMLSSPIERAAFNKLKKLLWGTEKSNKDALSNISLNEEKGIFSLTTQTTDESLSINITDNFYRGIKEFFEDEVFENQKKSTMILKSKTDSVLNLRNSKIYQLARFEDRNKGLLLQEDDTKRAILTNEIQVLNVAYGELLKNYEMTDINLKNLQPLFMEIDRPFSPIQPSQSSLLVNLVKGLIIGTFIGILFVVGRKTFIDIMK